MSQYCLVDMIHAQHAGFNGQMLSKLKKCEVPPDRAAAYFFQWKPEFLQELLGISELGLQELAKNGMIPKREGSKIVYYDPRKIVKMLHAALTESGDVNVDKDLKLSRKKKLDLENDIREKKLISRKKAEDRSIRILKAASTIIQYAIKKSAVMVVGCVNSIDAEEILRSQYGEAIRFLKENAEHKEWIEEVSPDKEEADA